MGKETRLCNTVLYFYWVGCLCAACVLLVLAILCMRIASPTYETVPVSEPTKQECSHPCWKSNDLKNITVLVGEYQRHIIYCVSQTCDPCPVKPTVRWQFNGSDIKDTGKVNVYPYGFGSLVLSGISKDDQGTYTCNIVYPQTYSHN